MQILIHSMISRQERIATSMKSLTIDDQSLIKLDNLKEYTQRNSKSNSDSDIQDLRDNLKSCDKVAHKLFVDTMFTMQAVYHRLIESPISQRKKFSPLFISRLKPEELETITITGGEPRTKKKRMALTREIERLTKGKNALI